MPHASAIPFPILRDLLHAATRIFAKEPTVLTLVPDLVIVGDIHGQILDLFRILSHFGRPPATKYLFLGDLVDRGAFSTETAVLLLAMKALWPGAVSLIRGNHEFAQLWRSGGFEAELESLYPGLGAPAEFLKAFEVMPLGAVVNRTILCLHGGIGPGVRSIGAIAAIPRPVAEADIGAVLDILWSDPSEEIDFFEPSNRGTGHFFGREALAQFLAENGFALLVRGHECEDEGFAWHLGKLALTVFSASGYCNMTDNKAAVAVVQRNAAHPATIAFPVLRWISRNEVHFFNPTDQVSLAWDRKNVEKVRAGNRLPMLAKSVSARPGTRLGAVKTDATVSAKWAAGKEQRVATPLRHAVTSTLVRRLAGSQSAKTLPVMRSDSGDGGL
jgi:protein phosphatase